MNEKPDKSLNPMNWSRNEKITMLLATLIGIIVGIIVGYLVYAAPRGAGGAISFGFWLERPLRSGGLWWAFTGAAVGVGVIYIRRLTSRPD